MCVYYLQQCDYMEDSKSAYGVGDYDSLAERFKGVAQGDFSVQRALDASRLTTPMAMRGFLFAIGTDLAMPGALVGDDGCQQGWLASAMGPPRIGRWWDLQASGVMWWSWIALWHIACIVEFLTPRCSATCCWLGLSRFCPQLPTLGGILLTTVFFPMQRLPGLRGITLTTEDDELFDGYGLPGIPAGRRGLEGLAQRSALKCLHDMTAHINLTGNGLLMSTGISATAAFKAGQGEFGSQTGVTGTLLTGFCTRQSGLCSSCHWCGHCSLVGCDSALQALHCSQSGVCCISYFYLLLSSRSTSMMRFSLAAPADSCANAGKPPPRPTSYQLALEAVQQQQQQLMVGGPLAPGFIAAHQAHTILQRQGAMPVATLVTIVQIPNPKSWQKTLSGLQEHLPADVRFYTAVVPARLPGRGSVWVALSQQQLDDVIEESKAAERGMAREQALRALEQISPALEQSKVGQRSQHRSWDRYPTQSCSLE